MKKFILFWMSFCISLLANAQATDLMIDCQTPGWLSSMIKYGDQQTVRNLKVTGYINSDDLAFIGTLILSQKLDGELDLSECYLANSGYGDNYLTGLGIVSEKDSIRVYRIPKSVTKVGGCIGTLHVDTLYFDCEMNYIDQKCFGQTDISYLYVGEKIDSIPGRTLLEIGSRPAGVEGFENTTRLTSIHLSSDFRYIGDCSFVGSSIKYVNFEDLHSLDYIGEFAFTDAYYGNLEWCFLPDTLWIDSKYFNASAFGYKEGQHLFIGKRCEEIGTGRDLRRTYGFGDNLVFHMESPTPPSGHGPNRTCTVYVPKGSKAAYQNQWGSANIIELNPVESVELNNHEIVMNKGENCLLSASVFPVDADDTSISWTSGNSDVAAVNDKGLVSSISSGCSFVFAPSVATGIKDSCLVVVRKNVTSVEFEDPQIILNNIGESKQLSIIISPDDATEQSVIWKSSNELVCSISSLGVVTATGVGTAVITVTTVDGGLTASCVVKVIQHVTDLALEKHTLSLKVGESEQLHTTASPNNADDKSVVWYSSNEQAAIVEANGNVTALRSGVTWITAVSVDNSEAKDSCKVTVIQPVTGVSISKAAYTLQGIGSNIQLSATVQPEDATNKNVRWSSTNESVCIVSNGNVVAVNDGMALVLVTTEDGGYMAYCTITVDSTNGIHEVTNNDISLDPVYDSMGRKVKNTKKGQLYLRRGKKFIAH